MPTYEYLCQTCSHRFDVWQKMTDEPLQTCPECGNHIRRVLYPAGIVFKGSGFYKTDHGSGLAASNGNSSNGKKEQSETSASSSSAEGSKTAESSTPSAKPAENSSSSTSKAPAATGAQS